MLTPSRASNEARSFSLEPTGQTTSTSYPARTSAVAMLQTRRSEGTELFSTSINTRRGAGGVADACEPSSGTGAPEDPGVVWLGTACEAIALILKETPEVADSRAPPDRA